LSATNPSSKVAVVIATKNRYDLLSKRAIPSVVEQTRRPDYLFFVDDSTSNIRFQNAELVGSLRIPNCDILYIENHRSEGASGSWNTAIEACLSRVEQPESLYIAILDDDDCWAPTYLELCCAAVFERQLDMVAADLRRFESAGGPPLLSQGVEELRADDFLLTNPGIQGSNLFLRLSVLLAAGGFDEELRSTTDRDLCIRLADLGTVRYARLPLRLVDHFADSNRPRLSARGSEAKLAGLSAFWKKYSGRMTADQRSVFSERAIKLFDWKPKLPDQKHVKRHVFRDRDSQGSNNYQRLHTQLSEPSNSVANQWTTGQISCQAPAHKPFSLYVGVITSDPPTLLSLLRSMLRLQQSASISNLSILILDNGSSRAELQEVVRLATLDGLTVAVVSEFQQRKDAAEYAFGEAMNVRPVGQVGIAQARTMLQRYLGNLLERDQGSIGWILDDDMLVDDRATAYLQWLPGFREQGVDVLIGAYEGSSPNPPLNGLRVQLVDLFHNLIWLSNLPDKAVLPDRSDENADQRRKYPEYYYDLSRKHTGHLEMPHWLEPMHQKETVAESRSRLIAGALGILSGSSLTRSLVSSLPSNPLEAAVESVNRGGCTFVLNHNALIRTPNTIMTFRGFEARRSDMIWAIVNRNYRRMNIKAVNFPICHLSRVTGTPYLNSVKVQGEIIGSALYAGLIEFLGTRPQHRLDFSEQDICEIRCIIKINIDRRLLALEQSFYRISGLRSAIGAVTASGELVELLNFLRDNVNREQFVQISSSVRAVKGSDIHNFLASLRLVSDDFSSKANDIDFVFNWLQLDPDWE
jgi:glycosyltransferase involved in cell wall biosynthesis